MESSSSLTSSSQKYGEIKKVDNDHPGKKGSRKTRGNKRKVTKISTSLFGTKSSKISKPEGPDITAVRSNSKPPTKTLESDRIANILKTQPMPIDIKPLSKKESGELIEKIVNEAGKSGIARSDIDESNKPEWFPSSLLWSVECVFEEALDRMPAKEKTSLNSIMKKIKMIDPWLDLIVKNTLWPAITSTTSEFNLDGKEKLMAFTWVRRGLALEKFEITKDWLNYQLSLNSPKETSSLPVFIYKSEVVLTERLTEQALKKNGMKTDDIRIDKKPESQTESLWSLLQEIIDNLKICNKIKVNPFSEEANKNPKCCDLALLKKLLNSIFTDTQGTGKGESSAMPGDTKKTENSLVRDRLQMELMLDNLASSEGYDAFKPWRKWLETGHNSSKNSDSFSSAMPLLKHNPVI
ncbi:hypothetical protein [Endozoicomonas sp.]|uniref:hypothetical protein n=1 Tax=Endozoicomonas sp. TaxID=1892382 RepID=UPI0028851D12|nr:hypothetical protein [Endozoicomonas sp.]